MIGVRVYVNEENASGQVYLYRIVGSASGDSSSSSRAGAGSAGFCFANATFPCALIHSVAVGVYGCKFYIRFLWPYFRAL